MKKAAKQIKDTGICPVCWGEFKIEKKDRKLHKHGHGGRGGPYEGSYQTPSSTKAVIPGTASFSQGIQGPTLQQSQSSTASQLADEDEQIHDLKHPPWREERYHLDLRRRQDSGTLPLRSRLIRLQPKIVIRQRHHRVRRWISTR